MLRTKEWVQYKHPKYEEAEFVEVGGRKGHLLSKKGAPYKIARISVGDGWDLYKVIKTGIAHIAVEKVLLYLSNILGEESSRRSRKTSVASLIKKKSIAYPKIPVEVEETYEDSVLESMEEVESWFRRQFKCQG